MGRACVAVAVVLIAACAEVRAPATAEVLPASPVSAASPSVALSPFAGVPATAAPTPAASPMPAASPTPVPTPAPGAGPTPVTRTISGRATVATTGIPVAGVRIRGSPISIGGLPALPTATAVTDDRGAYTLSVLTWSEEALAGSSSSALGPFVLGLDVTPPQGFVLLSVTSAIPGGLGGIGPLLAARAVGPVDITLGPGHVVVGRVTSGFTGAPLAGVYVSAVRPDSLLVTGGQGDAFGQPALATTTDAAGRYGLTVPTGTYVIYASGDSLGLRFWSDDPAVFQATSLRVERGLTGIDVVLVPVTSIAGQVAQGVGDIRVVAYLAGSTPCCTVAGRAITGQAGTFIMYVPRGVYHILFDPPAGSPYAQRWWTRTVAPFSSGAASFGAADDISVGESALRIGIEMGRAGP